MANIIIASTRKSGGKTGLAVGLARALGKKMGYIKPLGDRLLYRKKRLWDYDAAVVIEALGSSALAEELTIGFEQAKLRYMYDEAQVVQRLTELAQINGEGQEHLLVEAGSDLAHGTSVHLDAVSVARTIGGKLLVVAAGGEDAIVDDLAYLKKYVALNGVELMGVVANKVVDPDDFEMTHLPELKKLGVPVLGVLPYRKELTRVTVQFLSDCLFARVIAGEGRMNRPVYRVFVGASSADSVLREPAFQKENKLVITSGDRADIILAALESVTAGIVLTNNILPPPNIVSKAQEQGVPLLLVPGDTFAVAKQVDDLEPLVTREDEEKKALLEQMVRERVDLSVFA
jgi:BioD-like phosphotransacetylase family protein